MMFLSKMKERKSHQKRIQMNQSIIYAVSPHHRPPITSPPVNPILGRSHFFFLFSSVELIYQFSKPSIKIPTFPRRKRSFAQSIEVSIHP
jgi:hypothetical protein